MTLDVRGYVMAAKYCPVDIVMCLKYTWMYNAYILSVADGTIIAVSTLGLTFKAFMIQTLQWFALVCKV